MPDLAQRIYAAHEARWKKVEERLNRGLGQRLRKLKRDLLGRKV